MISQFTGHYFFLSNFYGSKDGTLISWAGRKFKTAEHIYQYERVLNSEDKQIIYECNNPKTAKQIAQEMTHRPEWETIQIPMMKVIIRQKFKNEYLKDLLLKTGTEELVEKNAWHDNFWGKCDSTGKNHFGIILMNTRDALRYR